MKKRWLIIGGFFLLLLLALWSPWLYSRFNLLQLFGINEPEGISGLQVNSLAGEIDVYLNGELVGTSSADKSPLSLDTVKPGDYLVTLKRKTSVPTSYWDFNKLVTFTEGTTVIISFNLGPEEAFSEGQIIYATKSNKSSNNIDLALDFNVEDPTVSVEDSSVQRINSRQFSSEISLDKQKKITVSKPGYENLEFTILPDSAEERSALGEFSLNVSIYLMLQPVQVE